MKEGAENLSQWLEKSNLLDISSPLSFLHHAFQRTFFAHSTSCSASTVSSLPKLRSTGTLLHRGGNAAAKSRNWNGAKIGTGSFTSCRGFSHSAKGMNSVTERGMDTSFGI